MSGPEKVITAVLDRYRAAVLAKDVDAFVDLYHRNVRVFDTWGSWSYDGIEAWRGMVTEWFGSLGAERVAVEMDDVETIAGADVAVAHAVVTYKGVSAEGKELRSMQNRLTWALRRAGGGWKIVHEHTSAPVDFETKKAILHR